MKNKRWFAIMLIVIAASSYGLLSPFIKLSFADGWSEEQVSASQMAVAAILMWLIVLVTPAAWVNPFRGPWIQLALIGLFGLSLTTFFYNVSLSEMDASIAIVLLFQFTWITMAIDAVATRKLPNRYRLVAIVLVLVGTVLSVNLFAADMSRFTVRGLLFGLLAAVCYSIFLFWTGRVQTTMHPTMRAALMLTAALPIVFWLYPPHQLFQTGHLPLLAWGVLLGILGQVIPTVLFNIGIPKVGSSLAALLGSMELPVAIVGAFLILGENVAPQQWAGMLLILAGLFVAERQPKAARI